MTENKIKMPHSLILKDRSQLTLSGVTDVDSFDENIITAYTDYGELTVKGEGLHISILNIDTGELSIDGTVASLSYLENQPRSTSFFSKGLSSTRLKATCGSSVKIVGTVLPNLSPTVSKYFS